MVFCSIGDRIVSVNNIPFDNTDHSTAISVLKDSGALANLVIINFTHTHTHARMLKLWHYPVSDIMVTFA